jgi:hypothetical protein
MKNQNLHNNKIANIIDINNAIKEVWNYHPDNPKQIDPVLYHAILVKKLKIMEQDLKEFEDELDNV